MAKRKLVIHLSSPDHDINSEELDKLTEVLNTMEDWQLAGERLDDVGNFVITALKEK